MSSYPDLKWPSNETHLLFDVGFSYMLLARAQQLLRQLIDTDEVPKEDAVLSVVIEAMIEDIEGFEQGRLQIRDEIYTSAAKLADEGRIKTNNESN